MGRKDTLWNTRNGTYIETVKPTGYDILINGIDKYLNFNDISGTSGYGIRDNGGTMEFKNSGGAWTGFGSGGGGVGPGTINEIAYFDTTTTVNSLPVATYPSLTELSYGKGVTSPIQTQLNAKQATLSLTTTGSSGASTLVGATLNIPNYTLAGLGGANTALSNLSSVAINTSLVSDTTKTDDLGSSTIKWRNLYTQNVYADTIGYNSLRAVFGERRIGVSELADALWKANRRFTVTSSNGYSTAPLFAGGFENSYTIPVSTTEVININLANQSGVPSVGVTYPEGKFYVHFYYTNNNYSAISARTKMNGVWYTLPAPTDISTVVGDKVLEFQVSSNNYLTDIELTITTNGTDSVIVTALNFVADRWTTELEMPYYDKYATTNKLLGNITFRTVAQTDSGGINADGDWYMGTGGTGGHFGIGTSSTGIYHLKVNGEMYGKGITCESGYVFASLGIAYLRGASSNGVYINDSGAGDVWLAGGGGKVGIGQQYPSNRLHVQNTTATASANLVNIDGGATGFSGSNDAGTAYSLIFSGCSYQTSIKQNIGAKIEMAKENTWNYADTPTGTKGALVFYTSSGTPNSPTLTEAMRLNSALDMVLAGGITMSAKNIATDTTTGTKIGTATSQKLGFWNTTPIVQPTTAIAGATLTGGGGTTITDTDTFDGYTLKQIVKALRNAGLLA